MEQEDMKIKIVVVSKNEDFKMSKEALEKGCDGVECEVVQVADNKDSIAKVYNKFLDEEKKTLEHDFLVFMHADVSFNPDILLPHLRDDGVKYDLVGLCGTSHFSIGASPLNWWTSSNNDSLSKWGCVTHGELGDQTSWFSQHSPSTMDAEVACIDGLFIAMSRKAVESEMRFDEQYEGFDFYDTDISMQAFMKLKLKIGVLVQKDLCHYSVGTSILSPHFLENEAKFRKKWGFAPPKGSEVEKIMNKASTLVDNAQQPVDKAENPAV